MKPCIVSFSSHGRENYNAAMLRLIATSKECGYNGDFMLHQFDGYIPDYRGVLINQGRSLMYPQPKLFHCYNHNEMPYQFKVAMIQLAREAGYEQVIWCDSTICMVKPPEMLLEQAKGQGIVTFDNLGHPLYPYISDVALERLVISVEQLHQIPQIMACVMIFDFTHPMGQLCYEQWLNASQDGVSFANYGSTREGFKAHRHDQAVMSGILWKHKITPNPYGDLVYEFEGNDDTRFGNNFTFVNRGIR